jgi:hypothetical protein
MKALRGLFLTIIRGVLSLAIVYACAAAAADPNKVLRVAQGDIDTLDPQQWVDYKCTSPRREPPWRSSQKACPPRSSWRRASPGSKR